MNDKELLELAAKAAGLNLDWDSYTAMNLHRPMASFEEANWFAWNPLTDDGDALRLAVKLQMHMIIGEYIVYVRWMGCSQEIVERATMGYSIEEATRRAIVRAAAAIGESM